MEYTYLSKPLLNKDFRVFFKPKNPTCRNRRYIPTGIYSLHKLIGHDRAEVAIRKALVNKDDKYEKTFKTLGTVIFYKR